MREATLPMLTMQAGQTELAVDISFMKLMSIPELVLLMPDHGSKKAWTKAQPYIEPHVTYFVVNFVKPFDQEINFWAMVRSSASTVIEDERKSTP